MPASIIAALLNTAAVRSKALWVGGVDVIKEPAAFARYGVSNGSISVTEQGPGAVSSLEFDIDDPFNLITVDDGMAVRFQDLLIDRPIFDGWVDTFDYMANGSAVGRVIHVVCVGIETILDWAVLPADVAFAAGTPLLTAVQSILGRAEGIGEHRPYASSSVGVNSSQAQPLASGMAAITLIAATTITAGTTVREALRMLSAASYGANGFGYTGAAVWAFTVDFTRGIRGYADDSVGGVLSDYVNILVVDAIGIWSYTAENLMYSVEAATVRGVLVVGTGITQFVPDGSGKAGPVEVLDDATITTQAAALSAGAAYLAKNGSRIRGKFELRDHDPIVDFHPGSSVQFNDPLVPAGGKKVGTITKTFNRSNRENLEISFGSLRASQAALVRRLSRRNR